MRPIGGRGQVQPAQKPCGRRADHDRNESCGQPERPAHAARKADEDEQRRENRNERGVPLHTRDVLIEGQWINGPSAPPIESAVAKRR